MHEESLTQNTSSVLQSLGKSGVSKDFYLAGGTALALYFGHRFSVDLDWFAEKFEYNLPFRRSLEKLGKLGIDNASENTFNGTLNGVKISFFQYPYPLIAPKVSYRDNVFLAGLPDIAAMKLDAIATRGSYKDFIDAYFLLEKYSVEDLLLFVRKKFARLDYNETHLLKALTYFEGATGSEMPKLVSQVSWQKVTNTIRRKVEDYMKSL